MFECLWISVLRILLGMDFGGNGKAVAALAPDEVRKGAAQKLSLQISTSLLSLVFFLCWPMLEDWRSINNNRVKTVW